jgi:hypothetical protein
MNRTRGMAGAVLLGAVLLGGIVVGFPLVQVEALEIPHSELPSSPSALSPYWQPRIARWQPLILQEAAQRQLDPDLVAALIWRESRGDPRAIGPAGATGLMQIMPREAGFSWRPSRDELLDPSTNVFWGTRTLSIIIRQAKGDVASALAAYNGGWAKVDDRGPRAFAASILRDYAHAVAHRQNLDGHWIAYIGILDDGIRGPIWVVDSAGGDLSLHGDVNATPEGGQLIPLIAPVAVVAECQPHADGTALTVGMWVYQVDTGEWLVTNAPGDVASSDAGAVLERPPAVSPAMMAGSARPTETAPSEPGSVPDAPVQDLGEPSGELVATVVAASEETVVTPVPPTPPCGNEPLSLDTFPLARIPTPEGWKAQIYARASGGNCTYTYAWNDLSNIYGENMQDLILFEVHSTRRDSSLLGTVVVKSGEEIVRVRLYIRPPD